MFSFFSKKKASNKSHSLENGISEIEVYVSYGLHRKADQLLKTMLAANPGNVQLLELQEKVSKM